MSHPSFKIVSLIGVCVLLLSACATPIAQRITSPQATQSDRTALADGNSAFAFDLYQALRKESGNLFYSPYSISLALALAYAGARGDTQQQMADALHFTLPPDRLHPAFNALDLELARRGAGDDRGFHLNIANAIWGQADYQFLPEYLDTLAHNYGAGLQTLDFKQAAEAARATINNWISEKTQGRIKDLIPQRAVDAATRLILTNAIYFKAAWQQQFAEHGTRDDAFHLLDGEVITVPLMHQRESFAYAEGDGYQAVKLPYHGGQLSAIVLLPRAGQFGAFEDSLNAERVKAMVADMTPQEVDLTLPKFKIESSFNLGRTLAQLGMPEAFSDTANFSGMSNDPAGLKISEVIHKALILLAKSEWGSDNSISPSKEEHRCYSHPTASLRSQKKPNVSLVPPFRKVVWPCACEMNWGGCIPMRRSRSCFPSVVNRRPHLLCWRWSPSFSMWKG